MLKIALIKEGKTPPDERVVLNPEQALQLHSLENVDFKIQSSDVRRFKDQEYINLGISVEENVHDADVLLGVKEVPISSLIADKTYFFFSHTIKEQPYNRDLLRAVLEKNIRLIDWETLTDEKGIRYIGFGRYAGIVGAYNGFRAWGLKEGSYSLKQAFECADLLEVKEELKKVKLPAIKIALTGGGRVAKGAIEILQELGIKKVPVSDFLNVEYSEPVYAQLFVDDYNRRTDGQNLGRPDFYKNFSEYDSNFYRFAQVTDFFIAGHFYAEGSPFLFTRDDAKKADFNISLVADISCDIDGPVASTIRPSTISDPIYGYNPQTETEDDFRKEGVITVMAVDNLPCELPKDASTDFGREFIKYILPQLLNGDKNGVLERATIAQNGSLTSRYAYLTDYVKGM